MRVKYKTEGNGDVVVRAEDGRRIVINPSWWETRRRDNEWRETCKVPLNSPTAELRDSLFNMLYFGIRKYQKVEAKRYTLKYNAPLADRLLKMGRMLEEELIISLRNQGADVSGYSLINEITAAA